MYLLKYKVDPLQDKICDRGRHGGLDRYICCDRSGGVMRCRHKIIALKEDIIFLKQNK
jgi:hypothetical protein